MLPYPGQGDLRVQHQDIFYATADEWVGDRGRPLDLSNDTDARWGIRGGHGVRLHFRDWPELSLEVNPKLPNEPVTVLHAHEARHHLTRAVRFLKVAGHWSGYDTASVMADYLSGFFVTHLARRHWGRLGRTGGIIGFNPNVDDGTAALLAALVYGFEWSGALGSELALKALKEVKPWTLSAITLQTIANIGPRRWLASLGEREPCAWEELLLAALPGEGEYAADRTRAQVMLVLLAHPELEPWPELSETQALVATGPSRAAWAVLEAMERQTP